MILVDTSIWIEFFRGNALYYHFLSKLLEKREAIAIECIFGELLQGARSSQEKTIIKNYWSLLPKIEEDGIWLMAGEASSHKKLHSKGIGLVDLAILSVARIAEVKIWTLDKKLLSILRTSETFLFISSIPR